MMVSEVLRLQDLTSTEKGVVQWDVPRVFRGIIEALRAVGVQDDPVDGVSCCSDVADYLLFEQDGTLVTPVYHQPNPASEQGAKNLLAKISEDALFEETGMQFQKQSTLCQVAGESSKRFRKAHHLLPLPDAFNFLLSGVPRVETSMACLTQLYNPQSGQWSERLLKALSLPHRLLPALVSPGTRLGPLRADVAQETGLQETKVVATCSQQLAAGLAGLPVDPLGSWAYLAPGSRALIGIQLDKPFVNEVSREMQFSNQIVCGGTVAFYKRPIGFWLVEECRRYWGQQDKELDGDVLMHLAIGSTPFESLINPLDPRFSTPGDMPLKIQAFCRDSNQEVPRKPGPTVRCVLESLALLYRKNLLEIEYLTGRKVEHVFLFGEQSNVLFNHFIANALQVPVVMAPPESAAIGNVVLQALALGRIRSLDDARALVSRSFKFETILPHSAAWNVAYDRFMELSLGG
jgi:rhamnulokinase